MLVHAALLRVVVDEDARLETLPRARERLTEYAFGAMSPVGCLHLRGGTQVPRARGVGVWGACARVERARVRMQADCDALFCASLDAVDDAREVERARLEAAKASNSCAVRAVVDACRATARVVQREKEAVAKRSAREAREARARKAEVSGAGSVSLAASGGGDGGSVRAIPFVDEGPPVLKFLYPWAALDRDWLEIRDRAARHRATKAAARAAAVAAAELTHKVRVVPGARRRWVVDRPSLPRAG